MQKHLTQYPKKCIFLTNIDGRVKILSNLNARNSKIRDDIDELKVLMDYIINLPFKSAIQDYKNFSMPTE
ncbi:hypothetical protein Goshw_029581, partial [Gossypium schwendimanii]|nr:hypothetical protein [Gossypium schwendimanii]